MGVYHRRLIDHELDELFAQLPAIAIEGAKAVGKTETGLQRAASVRRLDDPAQREVLEADPQRLLSDPPPVLIDEWQYVPHAWDVIRRAVDAGAEAGRFLLTGSASPSGLGTHSGGGRIIRLRMRPMSLVERFPEISERVSLSALLSGARPLIGGEGSITAADYAREIVCSGFPGIRGLSDRARRAQLDGYIARVIDRDFPELGRVVRRPDALRRWMAAYAAATSTTTSFEKIRNASTSGEGHTPAKSDVLPYRDILERLFILDPLPGWQPSHNHLSHLGLAPKHHLADPALAARLLGVGEEALLAGTTSPSARREGALLGALFESLVVLSVRSYAQVNEARVGHLRTHRGLHEVDLIVERADGCVVAIEVKLAASVEGETFPHFAWLADQLGDRLLERVVVTTGAEAYRRSDGIVVVPAALLGI